MAEKRYYWLKLNEGFFRQREIKKLRKIAGGDTYTIIYLKLLLVSLKNGGYLYYEELENSFIEEMALEIDEEDDNVSVAINFLKNCGILVEKTPYEFLLTTCEEMTGCETAAAKRMRKTRERQALIKGEKRNNVTQKCNNVQKGYAQVTNCYTDIDIDIDKEKENIYAASDEAATPPSPSSSEEKKKPKKHKYGEYNNVLLTDDELNKLKEKFPDWEDRIENLSCYVASKGTRYKSHYATILNWARREKNQSGTFGNSTGTKNNVQQNTGYPPNDPLDDLDMLF